MKIAALFEAFDKYNVRHWSPATVRFYRQRLKLFVKKFGRREVTDLTLLEIDEYLCDAGAGKSPSTQHHNAVAVTSLQSFARKQKILKERWFEEGDIEKPRMGRRERIPTVAEMGVLLRDASPQFRRLYIAIAQSGARPGELCRAQISDIKQDPPRIELQQHKTARKTGKPRIIPIGAQLADTIKAAIGRRTRGPIFLNQRRRAWTVNAVSAQHRRLRDAAKLSPEIVLYSNRHFFATTLLSAGTPVEDVSALLGHANIATTQIYLHRPVTDLTDRQNAIPKIELPTDNPKHGCEDAKHNRNPAGPPAGPGLPPAPGSRPGSDQPPSDPGQPVESPPG